MGAFAAFHPPFIVIIVKTVLLRHYCSINIIIIIGECFLALGFELQPVEPCSPHSVRIGCAQHTPLVPS